MELEPAPWKRRFIWSAVFVLALLHWDSWFWGERGIVFGFLPVGLAYHVAYSIVAAALWALALCWAWPADVERWADETDREDARG